MVPFSQPTTAFQVSFNNSHKRTRITIERLFGCLKRRFSALMNLRFSPERCSVIIIAACILHNIARGCNEEDFDFEELLVGLEPELEDTVAAAPAAAAIATRKNIVRNYFTK